MIMKERITQCFNKGAMTYDTAADVQQLVAQSIMRHLGDHSSSSLNVLEIGCGTGLLSQFLLKTYPLANFLLTDISPKMIEKTARRFKGMMNVDTLCLDVDTMKIDACFQLVVSSMVLHWVENIQQSLQNLIQALTSGGRLVFAMLTENSFREWRDICTRFHVLAGTPTFPSVDQIAGANSKIDLRVQKYQHTYESAFAFLKSLQKLGALATESHYEKLSAGKLRNMLRIFNAPFQITYEIVYGEFIKP